MDDYKWLTSDSMQCKFVQNIKFRLFEAYYKIDTKRVQLVNTSTQANNWFDKFLLFASSENNTTNNDTGQPTIANNMLTEFLSQQVPKLFTKSHEQCILFTHLLYNGHMYAIECQKNIFVFILPTSSNMYSPIQQQQQKKKRRKQVF